MSQSEVAFALLNDHTDTFQIALGKNGFLVFFTVQSLYKKTTSDKQFLLIFVDARRSFFPRKKISAPPDSEAHEDKCLGTKIMHLGCSENARIFFMGRKNDNLLAGHVVVGPLASSFKPMAKVKAHEQENRTSCSPGIFLCLIYHDFAKNIWSDTNFAKIYMAPRPTAPGT
jgi:hypothetical protein